MKIIDSQEITPDTAKSVFSQGVASLGDALDVVKGIIADVQARGDPALLEYTAKFDRFTGTTGDLIATQAEITEAYTNVPASFVASLKHAKENIAKFHAAQLRSEYSIETQPGVRVGQVWRPIESVGLYAPGGRAAYPSSVLMAAVPAKVAGVKKLVLATPPSKEGKINPGVLVAARESGVDVIVKVGGAQAIAALAYGTQTVPRVLKIVGPGNKYVMAAKQLVSADVAIDLPAGPSDILVITDEQTDMEFAILDLFSQVEHDPDNLGVLIVPTADLAKKYIAKIDQMLPRAPRADIMQQALNARGLVVTCPTDAEVLRVANLMGAEHVEILTAHPRQTMAGIQNAGAIFLGPFSPVPLGDFSAGSNHVLPTGGYSRQYSGLNVLDFVKLMSFVECSEVGLANCGPSAVEIASFEGFSGHAATITARLKRQPQTMPAQQSMNKQDGRE